MCFQGVNGWFEPKLRDAAQCMNDSFPDWHLVLWMQILRCLKQYGSEGIFVRSRIAALMSGLFCIWVTTAASPISAQNQNPIHNPFFGFEFVLQPLAIKWACGGQRDRDLSQVEALIVAFPADSEQAELAPLVATLSEMASGLESLPQVLGAALNDQQVNQLCAAALPLNIDWVTPDQFIMGDESGIPDEQEAAWANFWNVVEGLQ